MNMDVQVEHLATTRELQDIHEDLKKKAFWLLTSSVCHWSVCLSARLSVCLSVRLSACLCLFVYLSLSIYVCLLYIVLKIYLSILAFFLSDVKTFFVYRNVASCKPCTESLVKILHDSTRLQLCQVEGWLAGRVCRAPRRGRRASIRIYHKTEICFVWRFLCIW